MLGTAQSHRQQSTRQFKGMRLTDHYFELPLDYSQTKGPCIEVFAREVVDLKKANEDLPWMIFFQGGPGFPANRPVFNGGWIAEALKTHRLLLLDQRGTGMSSRILPQTLANFPTPEAQAEYLTHFRADNIVRDAETIHHTLIGSDKKWTGIGQSYGGFCLLTYLSFHPEGLEGVIITGGVACVKRQIEENYRLTYQKVLEKNQAFYRHYPEDEAKVKEIVQYLGSHKVMLPSGVPLSPRRFQALGLCFGADGGFERIHYLIEKAFVDGPNGKEIAYDFLVEVEQLHAFDTNPIFCILHESIYAEGYATRWAAERLREEFPWTQVDADRFHFTGEMIYPDMLDDFAHLQPLKDCANILAEKDDWLPLYDLDQLAKNTVPVAAISYYEDMYVPIELSRETALHIPHFYQWVTNEWEHDGIGQEGGKILNSLLDKLAAPRL
ncbi:alpha/beta fold hydrolase [Rubritalea tangerina]|uniref:Alpha/beta fold hydrolase n=2 Tax=Rubritalea tangerina TaxID=430798 RepID=A0ABW4ZES5_9BACT